MIAVVDYGVGNLYSLVSSLGAVGAGAKVTASEKDLRDADKIILPGVGAFADAVRKLDDTGLVPVLREEVAKGKPLLGICLGMQLLFDRSFEYGEHAGLGFIGGDVVPFKLPAGYKVPHMGWNSLTFAAASQILKYTKENAYVYYVHSYYVPAGGATAAYSEYGVKVSGVVQKDNVFGTQFHPEKSGAVGLDILRAFKELK